MGQIRAQKNKISGEVKERKEAGTGGSECKVKERERGERRRRGEGKDREGEER